MFKKKLTLISVEIFSWMLFLLFWLIYSSCKKKIINRESIRDIETSERPFIYSFWHGRLFPMSFLREKNKKVYAIISNHIDGEIITRVISKFGVNTIRGSENRMPGEGKTYKNRGGTNVLRESINVIENGNVIAITPDGPRGPACKVKKNFFKIALEKDLSVINVSFSAKRKIIFSSWDNFLVPLPFSEIIVTLDTIREPLQKFGSDGLEEFSQAVENSLNNITNQADLMCKNDA